MGSEMCIRDSARFAQAARVRQLVRSEGCDALGAQVLARLETLDHVLDLRSNRTMKTVLAVAGGFDVSFGSVASCAQYPRLCDDSTPKVGRSGGVTAETGGRHELPAQQRADPKVKRAYESADNLELAREENACSMKVWERVSGRYGFSS